MPTESDGQGESPPDPAHSGSDQIRPRNRNRRGKQKNNTKFGAASQSKPPSTVEPELKGYYYELPNVDPRVPPFLQVVKAHIAYFLSNRKDASDYLMVGESTSTAKDPFSLPPLVAPNLPDWDNKQEEHDYLKKDKKYEAEKSVRKANEAALCAMLKRHCSAAFLSAAESHPKWGTVIANNSSMDMLKVFQIVAATGGSTNVDPTMMGVEAQRKAYTCKQKENQTNAEYLQVFMQLSNTARFCDCPMGASLSRLIQETGKSDPTLAELRAVEEKVVEKEMAMAFLLGADRKRYGGLIAQANNARLFSGSDTFPTTMSGAIELLNNSKPLVASYHSSIRSSEIGASFLADGQPSTESGTGGRGGGPNGRSGGGRNGGRGSSGRGGRGRDFERRPNRNHEQHETHITDTSNNNNNDEVDEYLTTEEPSDSTNPVNTDSIAVDEDVSTTEHLFLHSNNKSYVKLIPKRHPQSGLPVTWIVLDTGSTANIFCNRSLLQNIHKVQHGLKVRCNAGVVQLNMKGYFGDYPDPVWFNPDGIANILSFHDVNKHYHVVYDNRGADRFVVDFGGTKKVEFLPTDKGLYHIDLDDYCKTSWTFLETVKEQKAKHTKAAVMRAAQARHIQNIIGRPGDRRFTDIVNKNLLRDCPVTAEDIRVAHNIYGPNLGSLKGKTTSRNDSHVRTEVGPIPDHIQQLYSEVTLAIDILFVNKVPFLVSISRHLKFGTVERLTNRRIKTITDSMRKVFELYSRRNFKVTCILGDPEFEPLKQQFPNIQVDCCGADEHVPEVERFIRTIKDRVRSTYNMLPFRRIPKLILEHMIRNAVFWLNAFPALDGVSDTLSPKYIVTGRNVNMKLHVRTEFGAYVQTHEEHSNDMRARTLGAICLGPTGAAQGSHYFMSVATGKRITRQHWTPLPMPTDVIEAVSNRGLQQGMPTTLTFADRHGRELIDNNDEVDDDHDSLYSSSDASATHTHTDDDDISYDSDASDVTLPPPQTPVDDDASAYDDNNSVDDADENETTHSNDSDTDDPDNDQPPDNAGILPAGVNEHQLQQHQPQFPDENTGVNAGTTGVDARNTGVGRGNTGVDARNTGVGSISTQMDPQDGGSTTSDDSDYSSEDDDAREQAAADTQLDELIEEIQQEVQQEVQELQNLTQNQNQQQINDDMDRAYGERGHGRNLRPRKYPTTHGDHQVLIQVPHRDEPVPEYTEMVTLFHHEVAFLTEQMSAKKGLKVFGESGAEAIVAEMHQIHYRNVLSPKYRSQLTPEQRRNALRYLMFLKEKRCGKVKARGCADGRRQRLYKTKEETSAPTVRTESFMITCAIDAKEGRKVMTIDIPGAFMQADTDEIIHVKFEGEIAELLTKVDPALYTKYVAYEGKKPVIYAQLNKNLLQGALCWWKNLSGFLVDELGYEANPYDSCVVNKMINGKQCTIIWHVDDLKVSHMEQEVLEDIASRLSERYGKEAPLTIQRGDVHEYLGVTINFSEKGKVKFSMDDYVDRLLEETPEDMKGLATSPAANHLFQVKNEPVLLDSKRAELFHHIRAKLLYLCKRVRGDLMTAVAFLTTRVSKPDEDDYAKLGRSIKYLRATKYMPLTIELDDKFVMQWWVDASFAVHKDMKSHTGAVLTMGKGAIIAISTKQKINTDSSTVAELVGVHDAPPMIMWSRYFIISQGYEVVDNIIHQDNQSAMLLEKNGRSSCGRKTRALDVRYFSITDKIKSGFMRVLHCPTAKMLGDFFTKPTQGTLFRTFRNLIMNPSDQYS